MEYVIGIDSGGTNFRVAAAALDGTPLGEYTGETASHYYFPEAEMLARVNHHIDTCLSIFGGKRQDCRAFVCGTTGLDSEEDAVVLHRLYGSLPGFTCPITVINDAELAHYTVTGGVGVLVISGTGSIAFGRNSAGKTARLGGWMFSIMGEEGSGSWLTRSALRHLGDWFDGAVPDTPLAQYVRGELGITTRKQLTTLAKEIATPPWQEPKLGAVVGKAVTEGDEYAIALVKQAAGYTFGLAHTLARILGMEQDEGLRIGLWGSNVLKSALHLQTVRDLAAQSLPNAQIVLPKKSALEGAIDMALAAL